MDSRNIDNIFKLQLEKSNVIRETLSDVRIYKIKKIIDWIYENRKSIKEALQQDFSKPELETDITEIWITIDLAKDIIRNLKGWMSPKRVSSTLPTLFTRSYIEYYPKGVCLIIAPWNYPFQLCIAPLLYAIAGGNCAIIKPSESTPSTSKLIFDMINQLFSEDEIAVIEGDKNEAKLLLEKPFNHIFFTGSAEIGRKIINSSSKDLSSVTLELGGKSPVVIDRGNKLIKVARRVVATKFVNLGQTCIAPDYIIIHNNDKKEFIDILIKEIKTSYGVNFKEQILSSSLARIVNDMHFSRLKNLIDENKDNIVFGGDYDSDRRFISPTIIDVADNKSSIACDEIFGPILPILSYSTKDELDSLLNEIKSPLSLYIFSTNNKFINQVKSKTSSGSICINDIATQFINHNLPFGGVMSSGVGRYHGFSGFKEFSNLRTTTYQSKFNFLNLLRPPYTSKSKKIVDFLLFFYKKF